MKSYIFDKEKDDFIMDEDGEKLVFYSNDEIYKFLNSTLQFNEDWISKNFIRLNACKILLPDAIDLQLNEPPSQYLTASPKPTVEEGQTQEPVKCNGNCGMNYCDEYGCIENKPEGDVSHLLTPPPAPIKTEWEDEFNKAVEKAWEMHSRGISEDSYTLEEYAKLVAGKEIMFMGDFIEACHEYLYLHAPLSPVGIDVDHEAEKEVMMQAFDKVYKMFQSRSWIMDGRGSYPYNDDRYKEEVRYLYDEFESLHKDTWANIKSKSVDFRKKVIEQYKKDLENPYFRLSEGFSLPQSSTEEEKELWMALIKEVELNQFVSTKYKDTIEQLQSTYKISKR